MKNDIICGSCGNENAFYALNCKKCKTFLRAKVFNIDFLNITSLLIENPGKAFRKIIFSEHKNFIIPLLFFVSIKFLIDANLIKIFLLNREGSLNNIVVDYIIVLAGVILLIIIFSGLVKLFNNTVKLNSRFKDNFSTLTYSLIPHIFSLIILFPVELIVFGGTMFSNNPSPFLLKKSLAVILTSFEILCAAWSVFLSIEAMRSLSKNVYYGLAAGLLFSFLTGLLIYFYSLLF